LYISGLSPLTRENDFMSGRNGAIIGAPNLALIDSITQFNNGTQAVWNTITTPIPSRAVIYAIDTTAIKIGDGTSLYRDLPVVFYLNSVLTLAQEVAAMATRAEMEAAIAAALNGSPSLGGNPTARTQNTGDNSNKVSTTAYTDRAVAQMAITAAAGITPAQLETDIATALSGYVTTATLATTLEGYTTPAAVTSVLGTFSGVTTVDTNTTLAAANAGNLIVDSTVGSASTLTLPEASTLRVGTAMSFTTGNVNGCVIACIGGDTISFGSLSGSNAITSLTMITDDTLTLVVNGSAWEVQGGSAALQYNNRVLCRSTNQADGRAIRILYIALPCLPCGHMRLFECPSNVASMMPMHRRRPLHNKIPTQLCLQGRHTGYCEDRHSDVTPIMRRCAQSIDYPAEIGEARLTIAPIRPMHGL
jgi:hypothetical protein